MTAFLEIINSLRTEFIQEANNAPKLFKDLAKVEQYIAESYKTRSFIELIQNADDARSTNFGVHNFNQGLIIANNGRPFTVEDVEALCRSGSSNKYRGGNTIGYRGIGFKSAVNLAKRIYVFSGDFAFYFDKAATKKLLPDMSDVPLIRIPHPYSPDKDDSLFGLVGELKNNHHYTTLFVFVDINKQTVEEELSGFDRSSLLFLNNVQHVHFDTKNIQRTIAVEKKVSNSQNIIAIKEAENNDEWEILQSQADRRDMIAFKRSDGAIVPAAYEESVIHSFTPTTEFAGAYFKINGDYSTDPSRKNIDIDEFSQKSFDNVISLLADTICDVLEGKTARKGFFSPFINITGREGSKFRGLLFRGVVAKLNDRELTINGRKTAFSSIRLRPDWLNYEDYERLCHSGLTALSKDLISHHPELPIFLEQLGVKKLYLDETVEKVNKTKISNTGAGQIVTKVINQYRYDLNPEKVKRIKSLKVFPVNDKLVSADDVKSIDELNNDFADYVLNNADHHDVKPFFSKLNISVESRLPNKTPSPEIISPQSSQPTETTTSGEIKPKSLFKSTPNLQKWRSAEKNTQEYLKALEDVLSVTDVSNANMGYDLEVLLKNGKKLYIEIKSVSSFSEPIKITNNEYSSAHSYGSSYCLAIVINDEPFQIKLIPDPIRTLFFEKQIERWSWFCESYRDGLKEVDDIFASLSFGGQS